MKPVVRAFIWNPDGNILMTRHKKDHPLVLPGGHVEQNEALHEAMIREIQEEFGISARFFDIDSHEVLHHRGKKLTMHPLPIASYDLNYTTDAGKDKSRTEYIFLMETDEAIEKIQTDEIVEYAWIDPETLLTMEPNRETWDFTIEVLEKILGNEEDE